MFLYREVMDRFEARRQVVLQLIKTRFEGSQSAFARATGLSPSYLTRMLKESGDDRKRIGDDMAERLEGLLNLPSGRLLNPLPDRQTEAPRPAQGALQLSMAESDSTWQDPEVSIPILDVRASMGTGAAQLEHDDPVRGIRVNRNWLSHQATFSRPENLALITGYGDSMRPTFSDGDMLLVDRGITEIKVDAVYVLALNDELYIKRLQRRPNGAVVMISDNKAYEPYVIENGEKEKFQVLGRVVLAWNAHRL